MISTYVKTFLSRSGKYGWLRHGWTVLALLVVMSAIGYGSYRYHWVSDQTQNLRNSVSPQSIQALADISAPIEILAFASNSPFKGRYFRKSISALIQRYQAHKADMHLQFIDPGKAPDLSRQFGIKQEGEMVVQLLGRSAHMQLPYTEEAFTNVLLKLTHGPSQHLIFSDGHGEPNIEDTQPEGYARFVQSLSKHGFQYRQSSNLSPLDTTPIMVIHGAKTDFSSEEIRQVSQYIERGGDLIWLLDNGDLGGLATIADLLSIDISQGVVLDSSHVQYGMNPRLVSASAYARHAIFDDFGLRTFFFMPHRISAIQQRTTWHISPLIGVAQNGWLTAKAIEMDETGLPSFKDHHHVAGPINIAMAIERHLKDKHQRIIIVGDSEFLSNRDIDLGSNQQLGLRMVQWVSHRYPQVNIPLKLTRDSIVVLPQDRFHHSLITLIFNGFQFLIPCILLLFGFNRWRTRHSR